MPRPGGDPLSRLFRALANERRRRILDRLRQFGPRTVEELVSGLSIDQPLTSHYLSILAEAQLVHRRSSGRSTLNSFNSAGFDMANVWFDELFGDDREFSDVALSEPALDKVFDVLAAPWSRAVLERVSRCQGCPASSLQLQTGRGQAETSRRLRFMKDAGMVVVSPLASRRLYAMNPHTIWTTWGYLATGPNGID